MEHFIYTVENFKPSTIYACYYDVNNETRCDGYVGHMLMSFVDKYNLTVYNKAPHSCGTSTTEKGRIYAVYKGVRISSLLLDFGSIIAFGTQFFMGNLYNITIAMNNVETTIILTLMISAR